MPGRLWQIDSELAGALIELPLYRLLTRGRVRIVPEALKDELRSWFTEEQQHVQHGELTIEHVLLQRWHEYWSLPYDWRLDLRVE